MSLYWVYTCTVFILAVILLSWIYYPNSGNIVTTYCINLPHEYKRRRHIQRHFASFRVRFIDAIDTRDEQWRLYTDHLTDEAIHIMERNLRAGKREQHHELTPGAIGCFLSHLKCYHTFLQEDESDNVLLVLEDDSIPNPHFIPNLRLILKDLPDDADLILLSHLFNGIKEPTPHTALDLASRDSSFFLTNCYLITRNGILKILDHQKAHHDKFDCQIDAYLSRLVQQGIIKLYLTKDIMCPQSNEQFFTSIQTLSVG